MTGQMAQTGRFWWCFAWLCGRREYRKCVQLGPEPARLL